VNRLGVWVSFLNPTYDTYNAQNLYRTPNWVSWELNKSWLGGVTRSLGTSDFKADEALPFSPIVTTDDYYNVPPLVRGHMAASSDRNRELKDMRATFLLSNILPQHAQNNNSQSAWAKFEQYLSGTLVGNDAKNQPGQNKYLYITAGGYGSLGTIPPGYIDRINIPEFTWKVVLVLDKPYQGIEDIKQNTNVISIITPNVAEPGSFPYTLKLPNGGREITVNNLDEWQDWHTWRVDTRYIEQLTGYNLFSNLPQNIQDLLESRNTDPTTPVPLLASNISNEPELNYLVILPTDLITNGSIGHYSFTQDNSFTANGLKILDPHQTSTTQIGIHQVDIAHVRTAEIGSSQIDPSQEGLEHSCTTQSCFTEVNVFKGGLHPSTSIESSISEIRPNQDSVSQVSSTKISTLKVGIIQNSSVDSSASQANISQVSTSQVSTSQVSTSQILFPSSIASEQFFSSHNTSPTSIFNINNTALTLWNLYLQPTTPLNLNIEIKDLPTGQLAEANITGFNPTGRPNAGTLTLDVDANGLGWYIDPTPWDNSEYSQTLTNTAYRATLGSDAYNHYDLLTTLLHETGHLQGFIAGYSNYDSHIQTQNSSKTPGLSEVEAFIGDSFSAILTPDGSHLNSSVYTYDLMNTTLTPGVRKLPSALDIQILNTLRNPQPIANSTTPALTAPLNAGALIAINNGGFDTNTDWYTRGDSHILNGQAILSEDSPYLSHLSQTFVIPQGAKALQFTLVNTDLHSSNTRLAPGDAFEVALLNHTTNTSVLAPLTGLSQTDALLNIQTNGQTYFNPAITLAGTHTSGSTLDLKTPRTVQIDVSSVAPGTVVTLYFDLLGFGAKDSSVTLDDVQILAELSQAPIAQNDSATTNQNESVTVDVLENDRDPDGTLVTSTLLIAQAPQHGKVSLNANGTVTYQPTANYIGSDRFTYPSFVTLDRGK
jgi:DNA/RNA endonuclease G (NUC1)